MENEFNHDFQYEVIERNYTPTHIVDWGVVEMEQEEANKHPQIIKWDSSTTDHENGTVVRINSQIFVGSNTAHHTQNSVYEGTFYNYKGYTDFLVHSKEVTNDMIAMMAFNHFEKFADPIKQDTYQKSQGKNAYDVKLKAPVELLNDLNSK